MSLVDEYNALFNSDGTPKDVVAASQWAYRDWLNDDDLAKVDAMDPGDAAYFWTKLFYTVKERMDHAILYGMEERAKRCLRGLSEPTSATPFKDAESSISASSWFGRTRVR